MTNKSNPNKVTFLDEQLESIHFEYSALRRKLQSKVEALAIMSKELSMCRIERDQFKLMAEQVQIHYSSLKKATYENNESNFAGEVDYDKNITTSVKILNDLREENKALIIEMGRLKQRLSDRDGDIKLLRQKILSQNKCSCIPNNNTAFSNHDREELIQKLEILNEKINHLKSDLRSILDEKEELISEKEAYKCKIHRMNHELKILMTKNEETLEDLDIDSLIVENKLLTDRLAQLELERESTNQGLVKFESMLDTMKRKGNAKHESVIADRMLSYEQAIQLLESGLSTDSIPTTDISNLKSFLYNIVETLNDRTLALAHQRKANKILASRVADLDHGPDQSNSRVNMKNLPSQILLKDFKPSEVDKRDVSGCKENLKTFDEADIKTPNLIQKINKNDEILDNKSYYLDSLNGINIKDMNDRKNDLKFDEDFLPPSLEILVQKAVKEIKAERASDSPDHGH